MRNNLSPLLLALLAVPLDAAPLATVERAAVICGTEAMDAALRDGGDPNAVMAVGEFEERPLHAVLATCETGIDGQQYSLVSLLLAHGADVNAVDSFGASVLEKAVMYGSAASVEAILKAGADPNRPTSLEVSLLTVAEMSGNASAIRLVRQYGGVRGLSALEQEHIEDYPKIGAATRELREWWRRNPDATDEEHAAEPYRAASFLDGGREHDPKD